jgi:cardiolipin-specific phospholipase
MRNKKNLILLHGYLATSVSFYQLLHGDHDLKEHFNVYLLDLPGMGFSRVNTDISAVLNGGAHSCIKFFVNEIENWRIKIGLERFILLGHSFGGYLAAQYTLTYS